MDIRDIYKTDHGDLSGLTILLLAREGSEIDGLADLIKGCGQNYDVVKATGMEDVTDYIRTNYLEVLIYDQSYTGKECLPLLIEPAVELNKPYAIIALVSEGEEESGKEATKSGAEDFLVKEKIDTALLSSSIRQSVKCNHLRHRNLNLSLVDNITGLLSRRGFLMLAGQELKVAQRYKKTMFFIFIKLADTDGKIKQLEKTAFEKLLRQMTTLLRHSFRGADIISSFGDGSFAGLAIGAPVDSSSAITKRINENVSIYNDDKVFGFKVEIYLEVLTFDPEQPQSAEEMIAEAEASIKKKQR